MNYLEAIAQKGINLGLQPGMSQGGQIDQSMRALACLWDEPITYVKQYSEALQCVNQGYFISFFTQYCLPGEWVHLNDDLIKRETGFSPKAWRLVKQRLIHRGILLNKRLVGQGALFSLNDALLEHLIGQFSDLSLLGMTAPPLSINKLQLRTLLDFGVGIKPILFLAFIQSEVGNTELHRRGDFSPWVQAPDKQVFERTHLSRREQDSALGMLETIGVLESVNHGFPNTRHCRVSLKRLGELTASFLQR